MSTNESTSTPHYSGYKPCYDYDAMVQDIKSHRADAYDGGVVTNLDELSKAVDGFTKLSSYCSLTPRLWLLYAEDFSELIVGKMKMESESVDDDNDVPKSNLIENEITKLEVAISVLAIGTREFPGCAKLRYCYARCMALKCVLSGFDEHDEVVEAFEDAIQWVGTGSHPSSEHAANLWRLYVEYYVAKIHLNESNNNNDKNCIKHIATILVRRSYLPLKFNDNLVHEVNEVMEGRTCIFSGASNNVNKEVRGLLDSIQPLVFQKVSFSVPLLKDMCVRITKEFMMHQLSLEDILVDQAECKVSLSNAIEYGRRVASKSYVTSANTAQYETEVSLFMTADGIIDSTDRSISEVNNDIREQQPLMGLGSEITSTAFISYAQHFKKINQKYCRSSSFSAYIYERAISECISQEGLWASYIVYLFRDAKNYTFAEQVCQRACRNCPFSLRLFKLYMQVVHKAAVTKHNQVEANQVHLIAEKAYELRFFPEKRDYLEIYLEYTRTLRRELLRIAANAAPEEDTINKADEEEPNDNTPPRFRSEDHRALIQDAVSDLRRAFDHVIHFLNENYKSWKTGMSLVWRERAHVEMKILYVIYESSTVEAKRCLNSAAKANPNHAATWLDLIQCSRVISRPDDLCGGSTNLSRYISKARGDFQRAISTMCKRKNIVVHQAMILINEFLFFEKICGTAEDVTNAVKLVRAKLRTGNLNGLYLSSNIVEMFIQEQPLNQSNSISSTRSLKRPRENDEDEDNEKKHHIPQIKEKGVHPFTVKVTNLTLDTEDFDLIKLFRGKGCGNIVQARILRNKGSNLSKGEGLVQFEERESANLAVSLSMKISVNNNLVTITKSTHPAVFIVPPGKHRTGDKEFARLNKNNLKQGATRSGVEKNGATMEQEKKDKANRSMLQFKPRGLSVGGIGKRKEKISLAKSSREIS